MELDGTWFASVEAAGPGFINFRLADSWYGDVLGNVAAEGADLRIMPMAPARLASRTSCGRSPVV